MSFFFSSSSSHVKGDVTMLEPKKRKNTRRLSEKDVTTSPWSGSAAPIERLIDGLSPSLASLRGADTSGLFSPFGAALSLMRSGRQLLWFSRSVGCVRQVDVSSAVDTENTEYICAATVHLVLFTEEPKHASSFVSSSSEVLHKSCNTKTCSSDVPYSELMCCECTSTLN